jgi:predicted transcriptional regulator
MQFGAAEHVSEVFKSPRHEALRRLLRENRRLAQMTQRELATRLGRWQSFVSDVESGRYG